MMDIIKRLAGREVKILDESDYFVSAVLLPIVGEDSNPHLLFEVRSAQLKRQPGEVCFPGGKVENHELSAPRKTAIRETCEELGITPDQIEFMGPLDVLVTPHGAIVYPYVCKLTIAGTKPNRAEVEHVFTVPLEFFINTPPQMYSVDVAVRYGPNFPYEKVPPTYKEGWQKRWSIPMYSYQYGEYFIWGFTARIIFDFIKLCWPHSPAVKNTVNTIKE